MNKLQQLLQQYCPNGVEWKTLGEVTNYEQPTNYLVSSTNYNDCYDTPVLTAGQTFILGYTNEKSGIYKASHNPVIIFDDFTTANKWVTFDFKAKSSAMKIITSKNENIALLKYIYYWLNTMPSGLIEGDHKRHWISEYNNKTIPIPPLPVQTEIVRILDKFTALTAELKAELKARKTQYEYYRNQLLTQSHDTQRVVLKSIVKHSCSGGTPTKGNRNYYENGTIPWLRTQDVKFNEIYEINSYITEEAIKKTSVKWIPANCVIIAISGATAGRCAINKIPTTTNQHCLNMEIDSSKALYKYVYYCVCSQYEELLSKKQGARGDLNSTLIMGIKIPLPSLVEQARIVSILDKFDTLVNSISEGLPKEIELRQKQYEYYRNLLLTFPQKNE